LKSYHTPFFGVGFSATSGYKQKACHNFCITPRQFYRDTKLIVIYLIRKTGSGQFLLPGQLYLSPGLAKIAPWWLVRRDNFVAKVQDS
jgi:hypothetical protein